MDGSIAPPPTPKHENMLQSAGTLQHVSVAMRQSFYFLRKSKTLDSESIPDQVRHMVQNDAFCERGLEETPG